MLGALDRDGTSGRLTLDATLAPRPRAHATSRRAPVASRLNAPTKKRTSVTVGTVAEIITGTYDFGDGGP